MDDDGLPREVRQRLARGTTPNPATSERQQPLSVAGERQPRGTQPHPVAGERQPRGTQPHPVAGERLPRGTQPHPVASGPAPRSSGSMAAGGAPGSASEEPARSIHEAVERLVAEVEVEDAIAEWMQADA